MQEIGFEVSLVYMEHFVNTTQIPIQDTVFSKLIMHLDSFLDHFPLAVHKVYFRG